MADDKPLTDDEAYGRLHDAVLALGSAPGATIRANTSLKAARETLVLIQMGLIKSMDDEADRNAAVRGSSET